MDFPNYRIVFPLISVVFFATNALCSESSVYEKLRRGTTLTMEEQREYAGMLAADFQGIDDVIPSLSPDEQKWLKVEIDDELARTGGKYTSRAEKALNSTVNRKRAAKDTYHSLAQSARLLSISDPHVEGRWVAGWNMIALSLMNTQTQAAVAFLAIQDDINRRPLHLGATATPTSFALSRVQMGLEIQVSIVQPYLERIAFQEKSAK